MGKLSAVLNNRVAFYRTEKKLTQEQLARAAYVSRQTINAIEGGMYNPSTVLALRLSFFLNVSVNELFSLPEASIVDLQDKRALIDAIDEKRLDR